MPATTKGETNLNTLTVIVGHNVGSVPTHTTESVVPGVLAAAGITEVYTVATGDGQYNGVGESCTVVIGTTSHKRIDVVNALRELAHKLHQESIGIVWQDGTDTLAYANSWVAHRATLLDTKPSPFQVVGSAVYDSESDTLTVR